MITYEKELINILKQSEKEAINLNHQYVGTEHILLAILNTNNSYREILNCNNINYEKILKNIKALNNNNYNYLIYTPLLKKLLIISSENNVIKLNNLIKNIIKNNEGIAITILNKLNANLLNIYNQINNKIEIQYGINLNDEKKHEPTFEREKEINEIIEVLCRKNKNNPLLIGKAGVGKTALVEELAYRIKNKKVPNYLLNYKIISINLSQIVSGTKYRGEFEEKLNNIIKEIESNSNIILFIDEIHTLIGAGGSEGAIDAANILKPSLARNKIKCIGATTIEEYNNTILKDKALNRRFNKIIIEEPTKEQTIKILKNTKKYYEKYHNVKINDKQIETIVNLSSKYILDKSEPDRSLDVLDKICTKTKLNNKENNKIEFLISEKEQNILNKKFKEATIINKKIDNLLNKKKKVTDTVIKSIFDIYTSNNIGFKPS